MSSFFSLGGSFGITKQAGDQEPQEQDSIITPNSLYLFKNEEIYSKGFEQYYHHQPPTHYRSGSSSVDDLCLNSNNNNNSFSTNNLYSSSWKAMRQAGYGISGGGVNCQDCGNQAKKDCQYTRCRTCCKSRGFQCQTHVKSTWVPAAKRRERQQQQHDHLGNHQLSLMMRGSEGGDQNPKRLREDHQLVTGGGAVVVNLPATHHNTSSGLEMGHFPAEVNSPAMFRCVRVSAMDEGEEQLAYQTAVNIGGHVFKGILYDHGVEGRYNHPGGGDSSSAAGDGGGNQQINLIAAVTTTNPNVASIDPTIYPTPLNAFMAGTQFFPPPRS